MTLAQSSKRLARRPVDFAVEPRAAREAARAGVGRASGVPGECHRAAEAHRRTVGPWAIRAADRRRAEMSDAT
jgi:hypothetical protein